MKIIDGGVTSPLGFEAAGIHAGIKKEKPDMALVRSVCPAVPAGTFTTNVVKAAPVKWDSTVCASSEFVQAVVVNSGVANACTGPEGMKSCEEMAQVTGDLLGIPAESVFVASTGVIGRQMPMDKIVPGIEKLARSLADSRQAASDAAHAIMTTDTRPKEAACRIQLGGKTVTIGGMCKGSGMIHPNMATMLCFVTTDAAVDRCVLQQMLRGIVTDTFNMISVDGDTSTNDSVLVLANGMAGNEPFSGPCADYDELQEGLTYVLRELSKMIAGDGEGATSLFEVTVRGAATKEDARTLARSVASSSLVKAALFGHDANWGRILCALGYAGVPFDPDAVSLWIESAAGRLKLVENGMDTGYDEEKATQILSQDSVRAEALLSEGEAEATAWGCDLTYDYVRINGDYRS